jgi:transcriptional regulator with XRE-family HTH domain
MSYELKVDDRQKAGSRFIAKVGKALTLAALDARATSGFTQQAVAQKLNVNRSVINRWLRGGANLTLRTVGEIAWALGFEIVFELRKRGLPQGKNIQKPALEPIDSVQQDSRKSMSSQLQKTPYPVEP